MGFLSEFALMILQIIALAPKFSRLNYALLTRDGCPNLLIFIALVSEVTHNQRNALIIIKRAILAAV